MQLVDFFSKKKKKKSNKNCQYDSKKLIMSIATNKLFCGTGKGKIMRRWFCTEDSLVTNWRDMAVPIGNMVMFL